MKQVSEKLRNFKLRYIHGKPSTNAVNYQKAVQRRITAQMTNARKSELAQLLYSECAQ